MILKDELTAIVSQAKDEKPIKHFLIDHPNVLTGAEYVINNRVFAEFPLGSECRADFAYIYGTSGLVYLTLIEIESPRLPLFTRGNGFNAKTNQPFKQLDDWAAWHRRNNGDSLHNFVLKLLDERAQRELPPGLSLRRRLYMGSRSDISNLERKNLFSERADQYRRAGIELRTVDALVADCPSIESPFLKCCSCSKYAPKIRSSDRGSNEG